MNLDEHLTQCFTDATPPALPSWVQYVPSPIHDDTGFVLNNHVIGLGEGLSPALRSDIMHSCMYAEIIANSNADFKADPQFWYEYYVEVLRHVGWEAKEPILEEWTRHNHFTPEQTLLQVIQEAGGQRMGVVALRAMGGLERNREAKRLFEKNNFSGNSLAFKLLPCIQNTAGHAIMVLTYVSASSWPSPVSWLEEDESVIEIQAQRLELNPSHHDHYRERVKNAVDRRSGQFFADIKL